MLEHVKVGWFPKLSNLCEIYQQTGMLFAFVSSPQKGLLQCHEWVKCRDFLADAVRSQITNKPCSVYGFVFNTDKNPAIDLNKMRMMVTKPSLTNKNIPEFKKKIRAGLKLLNHFENMIGVSKTKVSEVDTAKQNKYKSIFLFTGSVIWLKSPFLVSMYSFLIRLGDKEISFKNNLELKTKLKELADGHESGKLCDNDANYLRKGWNKLDLIMKNRSKLFPTKNKVHDIYWKPYSINTFHTYTGIFSLFKSFTPDKDLNKKIKML